MRAATFQLELHNDEKDSNDDAAGVLVFDQDGTVVQHNAAAEHRLEELGDLGEGWRGGKGLPASIWTVLGALKRVLAPETDRDVNGSPQLRV